MSGPKDFADSFGRKRSRPGGRPKPGPAADAAGANPAAENAEPAKPAKSRAIDQFRAAFSLRSAVTWLERDQRSRVVVDPEMNVLWANDAARASLRAPMPVHLAGGKLCFDDDVDPAACREFIRSADDRVRHRALVSSDGDRCSVLNVWAIETGPSRPIFVRIAVSRPMLDLHAAGLVEQFGLTRAEGAVAQRLALLATPTAIAEELGLSVNTVRTHIRRIYAKLSIRSQTQFLRLAHAFAWA